MSEIPQPIERTLSPEQADAAEALVDKRGISFDMAARAILGTRIESTETTTSPKPAHHRRRSGHVRDFESDRDHQLAEERAAYEPISEDQPAINRRGRAKVEEALDEAFGKDRHIKALEAEVERRIPIDPDNRTKSLKDRESLLNVLLRIHFEQKES